MSPSSSPAGLNIPTPADIVAQTIQPNSWNIVILNSEFENGFTSWTTAGTTSIVTTGCRSGSCVMAGSKSASNGDSTISQTFTIAAGFNRLSFYYHMSCSVDTVRYDWVTASLVDNTINTSSSLSKQCVTSTSWTKVTGTVIPGHTYTLKLVNHDDDVSTDPSYTLFDSVSVYYSSSSTLRSNLHIDKEN